ncbi:sigma-54 dependent transcriptional regulator [Bdellovibrio sp.]|uniref:sigma-54-dependent transcriptional regulator n=1 Tax=Bdellovibrio sp. TaxID=28201 RepID=UPI001A41974D|nr:MAG: acetoacetate metabolism regulatory protein AtoC [Oligoflexia bacterium]
MVKGQTRILVIEDDKVFVDAVRYALKEISVEIDWAKSSQEALNFLKTSTPYAVAIIDQHLPGIKGDELALAIRKQYAELQIIFATGDLTQETLTELLKTGLAVGFIPKGSSREVLLNPILKAIQSFEHERRILAGETLPLLEVERKLSASGIIGRSEALLDILKRAENFKRLPAPTLILGESGTGKEVIAHAFAKDFNEILPVNCSTFIGREHLMESELFGVVKGAFTGADKDRQGLFEQAKGRVIFLDEIHHLSLPAQAKLLRVLQEKKVVRVGDTSENARPCDFKIISAGKPELIEMMKVGTFLPDLYYRIATYIVKIPPLSERREDIEPLVEYFAKEIRYKTKIQKHFRAATIRLMESYPWTGEVRELRNMVEQLFGESKSDVIEPRDFADALERKLKVIPKLNLEAVGYETYMRMIETDYITGSLRNAATQKEAAQRMGMSKSTLNHRLKLLGINAEEWLRLETKSKRSQQEIEIT